MGGYNANTKWDNERSYLNGLISKGGGNAEWAKKQMNELNKAQQQYGGSSGSSGGGTTVRTPSVSAPSRSSGNSYTPASGGASVRTPNTPSTPSAPATSGGYGANTNWANENSYLNGLISKGGGTAEWAKKQLQTLQEAQKKYAGGAGGGSGSLDDDALRNRYFPGADVIPDGVDLAAGTVRAPNGDILPLHDWSTDTTDYGQLMLNAKDINAFREAAQARVNKANAQGINIYGEGTARTNEDLYNEWRKKSGYAPNYGDFVYKGWGHNSMTDTDGWIDNAGQGTGYYGMDGEGHWGYYEDPGLTKKLQNGTWDDYASSDGGYVRMDDTGQPDMTQRDMSRAGQTVIMTGPKGTWECTYSDNGYITRRLRTSSRYTYGLIPAKADNDAGVSSEELMNLQFGHSYTGPGSTINDKDITAASRSDYEKVMASRGQSSVGGSEGIGGKLPDASGVNGNLSGLLPDAISGGASGGGSTGGSGSTGGTSGGGSGYDLSEWLKKQYASALEGELAGLKDAYEKNNASLEDEEARLSGIYDPQRNRIAAQNALAKRVWDERAAANGLSSGANGQAELARSSVMQRDLASIGEEEANARADVSLRKKNLTIEYTNAITQARANGQAELAKALYNELVRVQGLEREDQIRESEKALKQAQAKMEYDLALKQMEADRAASSQPTVKPSLTASQAYTAYKNGIRTDEVMTAMQYYYGIGGSSPGGSGGTSGASGGTYSGGTSGKTGTTTTTPSKTTTTGKVSYDNGGLTSAQIKQLQRDMNKYLPAGQKIAVDGYWGPATKAAAGGATAKDYYYAWLNQQQKNSGLVNKQDRM
jgi:hypothetical protein